MSQRLKVVTPKKTTSGCVTCWWVEGLSDTDREAWDDWIANKYTLTQLWEVCSADPDRPLPVSITALRYHVRNHHLK